MKTEYMIQKNKRQPPNPIDFYLMFFTLFKIRQIAYGSQQIYVKPENSGTAFPQI